MLDDARFVLKGGAPRPAGEAVERLHAAAVAPELTVRHGGGLDGPAAAGAMFSPCDRYRYLLWRVWDASRPLWTFGMLNPSTADHEQLDPTITRCASRARRGGAGGLIVWNLFAWRATDPADMKRAAEPIGAANDGAMIYAVRDSAVNIAAWGAHGTHLERDAAVRARLHLLGVELHALAFTAAGQPRHPLYLPTAAKPALWSFAA